MRPVRRDASPFEADLADYSKAQPRLISRLGPYCSYCERHVVTQLSVEHIQPKSLAQYQHLTGRWQNFLLACVNCNSCKGAKNVVLSEVLLPDRDNTFAAFRYLEDGQVHVAETLPDPTKAKAAATLALTGLDSTICPFLDENGKQVAIDRVAQRMEAWATAEASLNELLDNVGNDALCNSIVRLAVATGFFSIWMTVFAGDADMRNRFVDAFPGTRASGCFDPTTTDSVNPAPNADGLQDGGKL